MCAGLFRRKAQPEHGRVMVPSLNRMVSFRTVRPNAASDDKKESEGTAPTLLSTLSASAKDEQKKVRIRWNVTSGDLNLLSQKLEANVGDGGNAELKTPTLSRQKTHSLHSLDAIDIAEDSGPHAAYKDGQCIEYFSATHKQWLNGTLCAEVCRSGGIGQQHYIRYHVTLANGQLREDVGLDVLRSPFGPHELVELSSGQQDGLRVAAAIASDQPAPLSRLGYRVVVHGAIQSPTNVALLRLKRRFPRGRYIEVYRGSEIGWQMAKIHHSASSDGCDAATLPLPALAARADVLISYGIITPRMSESSNEVQPGAPQLAIWTSVPICDSSGEEDEKPEYVPSYLLRLSTISQL